MKDVVTSRRNSRVASVVAILAVLWLWTVAGVTHTHADRGSHDDCPVCHVIHSAGGSAVVPSAASLPEPAPRVQALPTRADRDLSGSRAATTSLRGPPRSSLA